MGFDGVSGVRRPYRPPARCTVAQRGAAAVLAVVAAAGAAAARAPSDPIALGFVEGDVAGMSAIRSAESGAAIGSVEYRQHRLGDELHARRVARFRDGSSDEDEVVARVGGALETVGGRSVVREPGGAAVVDITIDVAGGRIAGTLRGQPLDERVAMPAGTYWGPLLFIVLKNFAQNAEHDRLVFHTVVPTPAPRAIDLELVRSGTTTVDRPGGPIQVERYLLRPTVNWLLDPLIRMIAPETQFLMQPGAPPGLARFTGPRNYAGQEIVLE